MTQHDRSPQPRDLRPCPHTPTCPAPEAEDASAARIVADHLAECGYALLCNGRVLLEGDSLLAVPVPPQRDRQPQHH